MTIAVHRRRSMRSIQRPDHDNSAALAKVGGGIDRPELAVADRERRADLARKERDEEGLSEGRAEIQEQPEGQKPRVDAHEAQRANRKDGCHVRHHLEARPETVTGGPGPLGPRGGLKLACVLALDHIR